MKFSESMSKTEKRIILAALLAMLICLPLFLSDRLYSWISNDSSLTQSPPIGEVSFASNDVRLKNDRTFEWDRARLNQSVHVNDSVFAGPGSQASIKLKGDNRVDVGENSLVRFTNIDGQQMSDLSLGNFRVKVDGTLKVAINGQVTELKGTNSEVQVILQKNKKPKVRLLKGEVNMATTKNTIVLKDDKVKTVADVPSKKVVNVPPRPTVTFDKPLVYNLKLHDLYETQGRFAKRYPAPTKFWKPVELTWETLVPETFFIEHSSSAKFDDQVHRFETEEKRYTLREVSQGENYWRISVDGKRWSPVQNFKVQTTLLTTSPKVVEQTEPIILTGESAIGKLEWTSPLEAMGYIVESSADGKFSPDSTALHWTTKSHLNLSFTSPGDYHYRVSLVNKKYEVSEPGRPVRVQVVNPPLLAEAKLPTKPLVFIYDPKTSPRVYWSGPKGATRYDIEISDGARKELKTKSVDGEQFMVSKAPPGEYNYRVTAYDKWNRKGQSSAYKPFKIIEAPKPDPIPIAKVEPTPAPTPEPFVFEEPKPKRQPSATQAISTKIKGLTDFMNTAYKEPQVQVEGATQTMVSSAQREAGAEAPFLGGITVRMMHWWNRQGVEGSVKSKVLNLNGTGGTTSPLALEARYRYRWNLPLRWTGFLREVQVSPILGIESHRNSSAGSTYSSAYDVGKLGLSLEFPIAKRWDTGGELLYGFGFDQSTKYEASGHLFYNVQKKISFGVGYRVHLFEAGSLRSSPEALPFREAYGEAYSAFRYAY